MTWNLEVNVLPFTRQPKRLKPVRHRMIRVGKKMIRRPVA